MSYCLHMSTVRIVVLIYLFDFPAHVCHTEYNLGGLEKVYTMKYTRYFERRLSKPIKFCTTRSQQYTSAEEVTFSSRGFGCGFVCKICKKNHKRNSIIFPKKNAYVLGTNSNYLLKNVHPFSYTGIFFVLVLPLADKA